MPVAQGILNYVVNGIEATPAVMGALLAGWTADDPRWDARPDPDRFTLREMVAHVADWDDIFTERIRRTVEEDHPLLPSVDEGVLCDGRDYAHQDPRTNLDRLRASRPTLVAALRALPSDAWDRRADREFIGDISLFELAAGILGHDSYHLRQVAERSVPEP